MKTNSQTIDLRIFPIPRIQTKKEFCFTDLSEKLDGFEFSTQSTNDIPNNYSSTSANFNNHIYSHGSETTENQSNKQLQQSQQQLLQQQQSGSNHNNIALIKIGEATALPVMLCGLLQKELFYQQTQINQQKEYMALPQNNSDYFKNHRNSFCSAYQIIVLFHFTKKKKKKLFLFFNQIVLQFINQFIPTTHRLNLIFNFRLWKIFMN